MKKRLNDKKVIEISTEIADMLYEIRKNSNGSRCYYCQSPSDTANNNGWYTFKLEGYDNDLDFFVPGKGCLCDLCIEKAENLIKSKISNIKKAS